MNYKIIDKDLGMKGIVRELKGLKGRAVKVGLQGRLGNTLHEESPTLTVVDVGARNEFGAGNIPERSFLRKTYDLYFKEWLKKNKSLMYNIANKNFSVDTALKVMGMQILTDIKNRILGGIAPDNAESTKRRKRAKRPMHDSAPIIPLIDTSQMINSLSFEVTNKDIIE